MENFIIYASAYFIIAGVVFWCCRFITNASGDRRIHDWGFVGILFGLFWPIVVIAVISKIGFNRIGRFIAPIGQSLDWAVIWSLKKEIHRDDFGILYESPGPYGTMRFVKVSDSTGTYWLTVPRSMERAKEAVAWTYNLNEDQYDPERV